MMTLEELKRFLNNLPDTFNSYGVVNGEVGVLPKENESDEDDLVYRCDKPIISLYVDENSKEVCFFHQTQEDVREISGEVVFGKDEDPEDPEEILS